ncbi:hypothetical protein BC830DRAFT_811166 [Chytriomyces sp. MP71]|nr:hypothetical protein BC830DRAFT_811166 [Chytriomyces sp. MP71]
MNLASQTDSLKMRTIARWGMAACSGQMGAAALFFVAFCQDHPTYANLSNALGVSSACGSVWCLLWMKWRLDGLDESLDTQLMESGKKSSQPSSAGLEIPPPPTPVIHSLVQGHVIRTDQHQTGRRPTYIQMDPDLVARFEALRATAPSVPQTAPTETTADADATLQSLAARLKRLTGAEPVATGSAKRGELETPTKQSTLSSAKIIDFTSLVLTSPSSAFLPNAQDHLDSDLDSKSFDEDAEVASLLAQVKGEVELERRTSVSDKELSEEDELAARLRRLHKDSGFASPGAQASGTSGRDTPLLGPPPAVPTVKELLSPTAAVRIAEDDAFCCLCSEDAVVSCPDCEDDLYCARCFKMAHDPEEVADIEMCKHVAVRLALL